MKRAAAEFVRQRAGLRCEYCRMPEALDCLDFQCDHIVARKHGGDDGAENLAWSCWTCNVHKGPNIAGVDAATGAVVPLFHPREDDWGVHFQWQDDELVGLTPRGRATIHVLAINAPHRVALRASLRREGVAFT